MPRRAATSSVDINALAGRSTGRHFLAGRREDLSDDPDGLAVISTATKSHHLPQVTEGCPQNVQLICEQDLATIWTPCRLGL